MENTRNDWLKWRLGGICASDAAAIHGASPYMTRHDLGNIKLADTYEEPTGNEYAKRRGNEMEALARPKFAALYNMEHGLFGDDAETFEPRKIENAELPFIRATLDGATRDLSVLVEFKYMSEPPKAGKALTEGQMKHLAVGDITRPVIERVPRHYLIQVQHQLLATGAKECHFVSFDGESMQVCKVLPDLPFLKQHLNLCVEFWNLVLAKKQQPLGDDDFKELRAKGAKGKATKWARLKAKADEIEEEMSQLREELLAMCTHPRMHCGVVQFTEQDGRKGSIDYQKLLRQPAIVAAMSTAGIDAEKFRKPNSAKSWKMEVRK